MFRCSACLVRHPTRNFYKSFSFPSNICRSLIIPSKHDRFSRLKPARGRSQAWPAEDRLGPNNRRIKAREVNLLEHQTFGNQERDDEPAAPRKGRLRTHRTARRRLIDQREREQDGKGKSENSKATKGGYFTVRRVERSLVRQIRTFRIDRSEPIGRRVKRSIALESPWLKDPFRLSKRVQELLKAGDEELAVELVRHASTNSKRSITVAWNHLINYFMELSKVPRFKAAWSIFNEMKQRGQKPDAYTFSLLLRNLPKLNDKDIIVNKALDIYAALSRSNSGVQPSEIHINLMLQACDAAGDMDAFWDIVGKIPDEGPESASTTTYTIILNALVHEASSKWEAMGPKSSETPRADAILTAKKIWKDVIRKWSKGIITMDSYLPVVMGRLLLHSPHPQDWYDVFSLVEQTTLIRRPSARLLNKDSYDDRVRELSFESGSFPPMGKTDVFAKGKRKPLQYTKPNSYLLHTILEVCHRFGNKRIAKDYWGLFANEETHGVQPSLSAYKSYMRILRLHKSGLEAVELLEEWAERGEPDESMFRLAMLTCARNYQSPRALAQADQVYAIRKKQVVDTDIVFLRNYLAVVTASIDPIHRCAALQQLAEDATVWAKDSATMWKFERKKPGPEGSLGPMTYDVLNEIIGAMDADLNKGTVPRDSIDKMQELKAELSTLVFRHVHSSDRNPERKNTGLVRRKSPSRGIDEERHDGGEGFDDLGALERAGRADLRPFRKAMTGASSRRQAM